MIWDDLDAALAAIPGTVSAYVGRLGQPPVYTRLPDATHYAASTMKVGVLVALYRAGESGRLDLDVPVPVHNTFTSALPGAQVFGCDRADDNDNEVWDRVGSTASLRWLARRMIIRSSNLATNIVLGHVGLTEAARVWALAGARYSVTGRGIEDAAARLAGINNLVTAADLAALFAAIATGARQPGPLAGPDACTEMIEVLCAQEHREDLSAGLPPGTRLAHKNGWVHGVRHGAAVIYPEDAPAYTMVICTTTELADGGAGGGDPDDAACRLIAEASARVWAARHDLVTAD